MNPPSPPVHVFLPAQSLRPYISHYWLGLDNCDESHSIVPDGAVDVVVVIGATTCRVDAFGTTTKTAKVQLEPGSHYLGIRFRPGQSRHFLDAKPCELTNAVLSADGAFLPDIGPVAESIRTDSLLTRLDASLLQHLNRRTPSHSRIDDVIQYIETTNTPLRVSDLANIYCKSHRQLERNFLDLVGLPPKLFAEISRFRRACAMVAHSNLPMAQIAALIGYADQSHLTHEFVRFLGHPPSRAREHVAFLQDAGHLTQHNADSLNN